MSVIENDEIGAFFGPPYQFFKQVLLLGLSRVNTILTPKCYLSQPIPDLSLNTAESKVKLFIWPGGGGLDQKSDKPCFFQAIQTSLTFLTKCFDGKIDKNVITWMVETYDRNHEGSAQ